MVQPIDTSRARYAVRRAALRAAGSSSPLATSASRQQVASFAARFGKANVPALAAIRATRAFSQTARVAAEDSEAFEGGHSTLTSSQTEAERAGTGYSVFVSNMTFDATDMHLREAFGKYGTINSISIGRDGRGLSRGFGFITFADKDAADRAVTEADRSFWHGRRITVAHRKADDGKDNSLMRSNSRAPGEPTNSLYIGNIPYETSDADLNRLFRELDNVTDVRVAVDRNTGWPRGFAHADFADIESAKKAYEKISATSMGGRPLRVDYSSKRERT